MELEQPSNLYHGFVCVVSTNFYRKYNMYRIGYTKNLRQQLQVLNENSPFVFTVDFAYGTDNWMYTKRLLIENFAHKHYRNSYFVLDNNEFDRLKSLCAKLQPRSPKHYKKYRKN
ncbi:bro-1 [Sucra jujuba nucleopolyhedrovirus]|uniref:Bro-1 n=1 Tax=Sucra jujuba nucleopolyhedrovirus TaxID=1563660 RepID=A0A097P8U0_9ABAC|nr:bro-1 [Sucra jujuba nucleopolyhedrovirus]AIU41246.1 bro-1 [Sucra jujuba nucleopolyhedrovirus]